MKTFFLILFLGKSILLTPNPVTLDGVVVLQPKTPLTAVTSGASLKIDVSPLVTIGQKEGTMEFRARIRKQFPPNTFEAILVHKNGKKTILIYDGGLSYNDKSTRLSLYSEKGVPTDTKFVKVIVKSKVRLENVTLHWRNYKH